jgi:tRNA pseudouridine55 synthase
MMRRDGIIVIDKPAGMTSHDVVARLRKVLGTRKIGHAGTLDPMATGVLVLGVGRGTRLLGYLTRDEKEYRATIRLGQTTNTDDADGTVMSTQSTVALTESTVRAAVGTFIGPQEQIPSSVSALKIGGKRAYDLVRSGETPQLKPRSIVMSDITVHMVERVGAYIDVDVTVTCSSGTYIRALARDLGTYLGVGGHLTSLRRIRSGAFADMRELESIGPDSPLISLGDAATMSFPSQALTPDEAHLVGNGVKIPAGSAPNGVVHALINDHRDLIALGESVDGAWTYRAVFVGAA